MLYSWFSSHSLSYFEDQILNFFFGCETPSMQPVVFITLLGINVLDLSRAHSARNTGKVILIYWFLCMYVSDHDMILVIDVLQLNRKFTLFCMLCDNIIGACKYFSVTQHHIKPCQLKVLQGDLTVCPGLSSKGCTFLQYSAVVHSSYLSIRAAVA